MSSLSRISKTEGKILNSITKRCNDKSGLIDSELVNECVRRTQKDQKEVCENIASLCLNACGIDRVNLPVKVANHEVREAFSAYRLKIDCIAEAIRHARPLSSKEKKVFLDRKLMITAEGHKEQSIEQIIDNVVGLFAFPELFVRYQLEVEREEDRYHWLKPCIRITNNETYRMIRDLSEKKSSEFPVILKGFYRIALWRRDGKTYSCAQLFMEYSTFTLLTEKELQKISKQIDKIQDGVWSAINHKTSFSIDRAKSKITFRQKVISADEGECWSKRAVRIVDFNRITEETNKKMYFFPLRKIFPIHTPKIMSRIGSDMSFHDYVVELTLFSIEELFGCTLPESVSRELAKIFKAHEPLRREINYLWTHQVNNVIFDKIIPKEDKSNRAHLIYFLRGLYNVFKFHLRGRVTDLWIDEIVIWIYFNRRQFGQTFFTPGYKKDIPQYEVSPNQYSQYTYSEEDVKAVNKLAILFSDSNDDFREYALDFLAVLRSDPKVAELYRTLNENFHRFAPMDVTPEAILELAQRGTVRCYDALNGHLKLISVHVPLMDDDKPNRWILSIIGGADKIEESISPALSYESNGSIPPNACFEFDSLTEISSDEEGSFLGDSPEIDRRAAEKIREVQIKTDAYMANLEALIHSQLDHHEPNHYELNHSVEEVTDHRAVEKLLEDTAKLDREAEQNRERADGLDREEKAYINNIEARNQRIGSYNELLKSFDSSSRSSMYFSLDSLSCISLEDEPLEKDLYFEGLVDFLNRKIVARHFKLLRLFGFEGTANDALRLILTALKQQNNDNPNLSQALRLLNPKMIEYIDHLFAAFEHFFLNDERLKDEDLRFFYQQPVNFPIPSNTTEYEHSEEYTKVCAQEVKRFSFSTGQSLCLFGEFLSLKHAEFSHQIYMVDTLNQACGFSISKDRLYDRLLTQFECNSAEYSAIINRLTTIKSLIEKKLKSLAISEKMLHDIQRLAKDFKALYISAENKAKASKFGISLNTRIEELIDPIFSAMTSISLDEIATTCDLTFSNDGKLNQQTFLAKSFDGRQLYVAWMLEGDELVCRISFDDAKSSSSGLVRLKLSSVKLDERIPSNPNHPASDTVSKFFLTLDYIKTACSIIKKFSLLSDPNDSVFNPGIDRALKQQASCEELLPFLKQLAIELYRCQLTFPQANVVPRDLSTFSEKAAQGCIFIQGVSYSLLPNSDSDVYGLSEAEQKTISKLLNNGKTVEGVLVIENEKSAIEKLPLHCRKEKTDHGWRVSFETTYQKQSYTVSCVYEKISEDDLKRLLLRLKARIYEALTKLPRAEKELRINGKPSEIVSQVGWCHYFQRLINSRANLSSAISERFNTGEDQAGSIVAATFMIAFGGRALNSPPCSRYQPLAELKTYDDYSLAAKDMIEQLNHPDKQQGCELNNSLSEMLFQSSDLDSTLNNFLLTLNGCPAIWCGKTICSWREVIELFSACKPEKAGLYEQLLENHPFSRSMLKNPVQIELKDERLAKVDDFKSFTAYLTIAAMEQHLGFSLPTKIVEHLHAIFIADEKRRLRLSHAFATNKLDVQDIEAIRLFLLRNCLEDCAEVLKENVSQLASSDTESSKEKQLFLKESIQVGYEQAACELKSKAVKMAEWIYSAPEESLINYLILPIITVINQEAHTDMLLCQSLIGEFRSTKVLAAFLDISQDVPQNLFKLILANAQETFKKIARREERNKLMKKILSGMRDNVPDIQNTILSRSFGSIAQLVGDTQRLEKLYSSGEFSSQAFVLCILLNQYGDDREKLIEFLEKCSKISYMRVEPGQIARTKNATLDVMETYLTKLTPLIEKCLLPEGRSRYYYELLLKFASPSKSDARKSRSESIQMGTNASSLIPDAVLPNPDLNFIQVIKFINTIASGAKQRSIKFTPEYFLHALYLFVTNKITDHHFILLSHLDIKIDDIILSALIYPPDPKDKTLRNLFLMTRWGPHRILNAFNACRDFWNLPTNSEIRSDKRKSAVKFALGYPLKPYPNDMDPDDVDAAEKRAKDVEDAKERAKSYEKEGFNDYQQFCLFWYFMASGIQHCESHLNVYSRFVKFLGYPFHPEVALRCMIFPFGYQPKELEDVFNELSCYRSELVANLEILDDKNIEEKRLEAYKFISELWSMFNLPSKGYLAEVTREMFSNISFHLGYDMIPDAENISIMFDEGFKSVNDLLRPITLQTDSPPPRLVLHSWTEDHKRLRITMVNQWTYAAQTTGVALPDILAKEPALKGVLQDIITVACDDTLPRVPKKNRDPEKIWATFIQKNPKLKDLKAPFFEFVNNCVIAYRKAFYGEQIPFKINDHIELKDLSGVVKLGKVVPVKYYHSLIPLQYLNMFGEQAECFTTKLELDQILKGSLKDKPFIMYIGKKGLSSKIKIQKISIKYQEKDDLFSDTGFEITLSNDDMSRKIKVSERYFKTSQDKQRAISLLIALVKRAYY